MKNNRWKKKLKTIKRTNKKQANQNWRRVTRPTKLTAKNKSFADRARAPYTEFSGRAYALVYALQNHSNQRHMLDQQNAKPEHIGTRQIFQPGDAIGQALGPAKPKRDAQREERHSGDHSKPKCFVLCARFM